MNAAPLRARRPLAACLLASAAVTLSACVTAPDLGQAPAPKAVAASTATFAAPVADWPADAWWTAYGDAQLARLIGEGLASSPSLAEAEARVRQAEAYMQQTNALRSPSVAANGRVYGAKQSYNNGVPANALPQGWNDSGTISLDLSYEFDFWGKNRTRIAAATSSGEAARADAAQARLVLSTGIASAYADFARLNADRDAAAEALAARARTEDLLKGLAATGVETQAAAKRAEAGRASAAAELAAVDEALALSRNRLAALMGKGPDRGLEIARPALPALKSFGLPADLEANLIGRRPDLAAARLRAEAAGERIKAARADFYPNVRLSAAIGVQALGLDWLTRSGSDYGSVGPAVSLPIFDGGRLQGAYRGARAEYDQAVASYDAVLVRALQETADVAASARALSGRLSSSREALAASRQAYDLAQARYRGGLMSYLDVLAAEDALIANRRAVADLETRAFSLDVALVKALGGGFRTA